MTAKYYSSRWQIRSWFCRLLTLCGHRPVSQEGDVGHPGQEKGLDINKGYQAALTV